MNAAISPPFAPATATLPTRQTGIIILALATIRELWCRLLGYEPKVLNGAGGSCLLPAWDFAHKTPHQRGAGDQRNLPPGGTVSNSFGGE